MFTWIYIWKKNEIQCSAFDCRCAKNFSWLQSKYWVSLYITLLNIYTMFVFAFSSIAFVLLPGMSLKIIVMIVVVVMTLMVMMMMMVSVAGRPLE